MNENFYCNLISGNVAKFKNAKIIRHFILNFALASIKTAKI